MAERVRFTLWKFFRSMDNKIKLGIITILLFSGSILRSQSNKDILLTNLNKYVDTTELKCSNYVKAYLIYVVRLVNTVSADSFCFNLGYIITVDELEYVKPKYYFENKGRTILVTSESFNKHQKLLKSISARKVDKKKAEIISKMLSHAVVSGSKFYFTFCKCKKDELGRYYSNSLKTPLNKTIYINSPDVIIEKGSWEPR